MKTLTPILSCVIYSFKRGCISAYSSDPKRFKFLMPADDWLPTITVGDVWICDEQGNRDPGVNISPVPVCRSAIGRAMSLTKGEIRS